MKKTDGLTCLLIFAALCVFLSGCAAIQKQKVEDTENILSAAGFNMHLADTPEKMAHLQSQPQLKMVPRRINGKLWYTYADAKYSRALYIRDAKAYQQYQKLRLQKDMAEEQENAAEEEGNMQAWYMWGPVF